MRWLKSFFEMSDSLSELLAGTALFGIICQICIIVFLKGSGGYHSLGLWIGLLLAFVMAFHMTWSLDRSLSLSPDEAVKKMRGYSLLRYAIILICLGLCMVINFANPLTAFLGVMGLKAGAYMQPLVHKAAIRMGIKPPDPVPQPMEDEEPEGTGEESSPRPM